MVYVVYVVSLVSETRYSVRLFRPGGWQSATTGLKSVSDINGTGPHDPRHSEDEVVIIRRARGNFWGDLGIDRPGGFLLVVNNLMCLSYVSWDIPERDCLRLYLLSSNIVELEVSENLGSSKSSMFMQCSMK